VVKITTARNSEEYVAITVEDNGLGLDPETAKSIFEPFNTSKAQGMGLGLAICHMIVQRHDGQLSAAPAEIRGAIFTITLPQTQLAQ